MTSWLGLAHDVMGDMVEHTRMGDETIRIMHLNHNTSPLHVTDLVLSVGKFTKHS